jgi:peptide/nickel transport system substrate-binding protein
MRRSLLRGASAVALALCLAAPSFAHDARLHANPEAGNGSPHTATGILSTVNNQGPKTADALTIGIFNPAANITTYTIGNSWNDWVLYLALDKLLEPSPYMSKGRSWLATEVVQVS